MKETNPVMDYPPYNQDANDHQDDELVDDDAAGDARAVQVGALVRICRQDPQSGRDADVVEYAQVVEVVDLPSGPAVRVAFLREVSDPIPLDPAVYGDRVDAPRIETVEA